MKEAYKVNPDGSVIARQAFNLTEDECNARFICEWCQAPMWVACYNSDKRTRHFAGFHNLGCKGPGKHFITCDGYKYMPEKARTHVDKDNNSTKVVRNEPQVLSEADQAFIAERNANIIPVSKPKEIKQAKHLYIAINTDPGLFNAIGYDPNRIYLNENTIKEFRALGITEEMTLVKVKRCSPNKFNPPISRDKYEMVLMDSSSTSGKDAFFFRVSLRTPETNQKFWKEIQATAEDDTIVIWADWVNVSDEYHRIYQALINSWQYYVDKHK